MSRSNSTIPYPVPHTFGMSEMPITFVQLVFESEAIAVGTVEEIGPSGPTGIPQFLILKVTRSYHGRLPYQIHVALPTVPRQVSKFFKNETCLLFLERVSESTASLIGGGDVGKWPLLEATSSFTAAHVQPLGQVLRILEALLKIDGMNRYEDRAIALTRSPFVNNTLGEIAALQYVVSYERWPEDRLQGEIDLSTVSSLLSAQFLLNKTHLDFAAEVELLQLFELVPKSVALPEWIERLMHDDVAIRDTAFTALQTSIEKDFGYDSRASEELRRDAVSLWQEWLDEHLPAYLKQDVPKLLHELRSNIMLRRQAANLLLCVISRQDVGFVADDVESKREVAVKRWEDWWKSTLSQL